MVVHFGIDALNAEWESAVVCIGTFDGVHRGHQAVLRSALERAVSMEVPCVAVTFDRHPAATLAPESTPLAIASMGQNLACLSEMGVGVCVVLAFDRALATVSAQEFLDRIVVGGLKATHVVVGHDFAMGKGREGTTEWISGRIATTVVPPFLIDGARVSSSQVRDAVAEGDVARAATLLGRPFGVQGVVVAGQKLGRKLGFPTVNVARSIAQVSPSDGVYAGRCRTGSGAFKAAISLGVRPAVGGGERTLEAYLLEHPGGSLYGQSVEILFHSRLRDEMPFDDLERLKAQIARDVEAVASMPMAETADEVSVVGQE